MFSHLVNGVAAWITGLLATYGYGGVLLSMAIQSACIPIPSEIVMPAAGVLVANGTLNFHLAAAAGGVGNLLGSWLAYAVGKVGGRPFIKRYGGYVLFSERDMEQSERFFARFGDAAVFFGRLLPVVRSFISLPAGIARMPLGRFTVYSLVGSWLWSYALLWAGVEMGRHQARLQALMHRFDLAVGVVLLAGAAWWIWRHLVKGRRLGAAGPSV